MRLRKSRAGTYANFTLPDEGRGRESSEGWGETSWRPPKVKGPWSHGLNLSGKKDREPEGVLESSGQRPWIGADGVTLSGLGQGGKR
jgi:hypothetical protein